jgi:hypothetical protein
MIALLFLLVFLALLSVAPLIGADSRSRTVDSWDRDSLWSHRL